ncbi:Mll3243 protein [hydrothermal vent metagenome]|uniref:Mll3243 protein n=1 Tax=hydrothermal vent metagenome TaxID=652676 RepID=A0A1W1C6J7_9ZZZZ
MIRKKILLIGDFDVGKTSLIRRYVDNAFEDKYLTTIGVKISKKTVETDDDVCQLMIWDVEGSTAIKKIPLSYMKGASGAIFVGDVTRLETIENIKEHIEVFITLNPHAKYVIAYNKSDVLSTAQEKTFLMNEKTFFSSAKENLNVDMMFKKVVKEMLS